MASSQSNHGIVTSCPDVHPPFKWLSTMAEKMVVSAQSYPDLHVQTCLFLGKRMTWKYHFTQILYRPNVSLSIVVDIVGKMVANICCNQVMLGRLR